MSCESNQQMNVNMGVVNGKIWEGWRGQTFLLQTTAPQANWQFGFEAGAIAILQRNGCHVCISPQEIERVKAYSWFSPPTADPDFPGTSPPRYCDSFGAVINLSVAREEWWNETGGVRDELLKSWPDDLTLRQCLERDSALIVCNKLEFYHRDQVYSTNHGYISDGGPTPDGGASPTAAEIQAAREKLAAREAHEDMDDVPGDPNAGVRPPCTSIFLGSN
jgi:hypothetical protein